MVQAKDRTIPCATENPASRGTIATKRTILLVLKKQS
jgi:hypothetical protein